MSNYKKDQGKVDYTLLLSDMAPTVHDCVTSLDWALRAKGYPRGAYKDLDMGQDRLLAAAYRHMAAMAVDRTAVDSESGLPHVVHAITNLMMLSEFLRKHGKPKAPQKDFSLQ